jgi:hypothetical protein
MTSKIALHKNGKPYRNYLLKNEEREIKLLDVPYKDKEDAKRLMAKWCPDSKTWYSFVDNPNLNELLRKYP